MGCRPNGTDAVGLASQVLVPQDASVADGIEGLVHGALLSMATLTPSFAWRAEPVPLMSGSFPACPLHESLPPVGRTRKPTGLSAGLGWGAGNALHQPVPDGDAGSLTPVGRSKLAEDIGDVERRRARADVQLCRNFWVGQPLAEQSQHFPFTPCQVELRISCHGSDIGLPESQIQRRRMSGVRFHTGNPYNACSCRGKHRVRFIQGATVRAGPSRPHRRDARIPYPGPEQQLLPRVRRCPAPGD